MQDDCFSFQDGWDAIPQLLEFSIAEVGYLVLYERTRGEFITLERFDRARCAAEVLVEEGGFPEPGEEPEDIEDEVFLERALSWAQDVAQSQAHGARMVRIQLRAYKHKGSGTAFSRQFAVYNSLYDAQVPAAQRELPPPETLEEAELQASIPAMASLADGYERFTRFLEHRYERLSDAERQQREGAQRWTQSFMDTLTQQVEAVDRVRKSALEELLTELGQMREEKRALLDTLTAERTAHLLETKTQLESEQEREAAAKESEARERLLSKGIEELGATAKLIWAAKQGLPPELMPLVERLQAKPELLRVLSDPNVAEMLDDDRVANGLSSLLSQTAADFQSAKQAPPEPAPEPSAQATTEPPAPPQ